MASSSLGSTGVVEEERFGGSSDANSKVPYSTQPMLKRAERQHIVLNILSPQRSDPTQEIADSKTRIQTDSRASPHSPRTRRFIRELCNGRKRSPLNLSKMRNDKRPTERTKVLQGDNLNRITLDPIPLFCPNGNSTNVDATRTLEQGRGLRSKRFISDNPTSGSVATRIFGDEKEE